MGDIIDMNLSNIVLPFAGSTGWDDYVFMITDVNRSPGQLKITAREI